MTVAKLSLKSKLTLTAGVILVAGMMVHRYTVHVWWQDGLMFAALLGAMAGMFHYWLHPLDRLVRELPEAAKEVVKADEVVAPEVKDEAMLLSEVLQRIIDESRRKKHELDQLLSEQLSKAKEMDRALEKKVYDLFTLFEVAKELNATLDPDAVLRTVVLTCMAHLGVTNTTLMLMDNYFDQNSTGELLVPAILHGLDDKIRHEVRFHVNDDVVRYLRKANRPVTKAELDQLLLSDKEVAALAQLKFSLCSPLMVKEDIKGVLFLGAKKAAGQSFSQGNLELLGTLIGLAALALENARLYTLAITDGLTKVYTHRFFQLRLREELQRSRRYKRPLTLVMVDVDHFKKVNDSYGHQTGDAILTEVAKFCRSGLRGSDLVARYGGEEFALLLPEVDEQQALLAVDRIRKKVEDHRFRSNGQAMQVTISMGIAAFPRVATDERELVEHADKALYQAKHEGRNRCVVYQ